MTGRANLLLCKWMCNMLCAHKFYAAVRLASFSLGPTCPAHWALGTVKASLSDSEYVTGNEGVLHNKTVARDLTIPVCDTLSRTLMKAY